MKSFLIASAGSLECFMSCSHDCIWFSFRIRDALSRVFDLPAAVSWQQNERKNYCFHSLFSFTFTLHSTVDWTHQSTCSLLLLVSWGKKHTTPLFHDDILGLHLSFNTFDSQLLLMTHNYNCLFVNKASSIEENKILVRNFESSCSSCHLFFISCVVRLPGS